MIDKRWELARFLDPERDETEIEIKTWFAILPVTINFKTKWFRKVTVVRGWKKDKEENIHWENLGFLEGW